MKKPAMENYPEEVMNKENKCTEFAKYRYTWPGRNESLICTKCAEMVRGVANAIGLHLQLIPLDQELRLECMQIKETSDDRPEGD